MEEESAQSARQVHASGSTSGPRGCIEFISVGEKQGSSLLSAAVGVALARRGSRVAYLVDVFGNAHAEAFVPNRYREPWPHVNPDLQTTPGQLRVALQTMWTAGGPRAAFAGLTREMSESRPEPDRTGWLSPEAVEAWEQPLPPAEHVLPPDQRRTRYQAQAARAEQRRMLADGEAGDIVAIDSGRRPRVIGVPVDYTLVVRRWDPQDWLDYEADSVSDRIDTRETARRLATRIGTPPAGPWALVVTGLSPIHPRSSSNWQTREYFDALGIELRELGLTGLDRVAMVRHHEDLRDWQRDLRVRPQLAEYGGPVHAFRPEGFLANGLDDLLTTVTRALHNRPQPRCPANPQPRHLPVTATR